MEHQKFFEDLSAYLDGELKESERLVLEEHLRICLKCQEHLKNLQGIWSLLLQAPAPQVSAQFRARLWQKWGSDPHNSQEPFFGWLPQLAWALGGFLLIWIVGVGAGAGFFVREMAQKQMIFPGFFEKPWPTISDSLFGAYERRKWQ